MTRQEFEARASAALGGWGWKKLWAAALECSPFHVSKVLGGGSPLPAYWVAVVELLEKTPPDERPLRWQR